MSSHAEVMYVLDGQARSHYPDILVEKNGRKELWEVKPESEAAGTEGRYEDGSACPGTSIMGLHLPCCAGQRPRHATAAC